MSAVADDFTWLTHPSTGGFFRCPAAALDDWLDMGWQPCAAPPQDNPVVAERIAWEHDQADQQDPNPEPEPETDTTTPALSGEPQEG